MRKKIRLTGRRQLPRSSVSVNVLNVNERRVVSLTIKEKQYFRDFPDSARVKLRLIENKVSETLAFGTVGSPKYTADMKRDAAFGVPSCQLRVVASDGKQAGLLLGSTNKWTLCTDDSPDGGVHGEGILMFQPSRIAPHTWKLDIRDDDYPIVYIDESIPNSATWVRNDPVFISCVLPPIIRQVFQRILKPSEGPPDIGWMKDWMQWADDLMPGNTPPYADLLDKRENWIEGLLDSFLKRHRTLETLVDRLEGEGRA